MLDKEIKKRIDDCNNDKEIEKFINERIEELSNSTNEITVGQNYTDSFNEFISDKVHYKPAAKILGKECPDLVYDDMQPYIDIIKQIKEQRVINGPVLTTLIFYSILEYLPTSGDVSDRFDTYLSHLKQGEISIKDIKERKCAFCSENSGLSHNMFKLLGIDSSLIVGRRDNEPHAYNFLYPNGYGNQPTILFDPSHHIDFTKEEKKFSFGFYKVLSEEECNKMESREEVKLNLNSTEEKIRMVYRLGDEYQMVQSNPVYKIGLKKIEKITPEQIGEINASTPEKQEAAKVEAENIRTEDKVNEGESLYGN